MNIINVPFSPLTSFKDNFLFSVERRLKFFAFSPKLQIGVSVCHLKCINKLWGPYFEFFFF